MACLLTEDAAALADALSTEDASPVVFVQSDSRIASITHAAMNGQILPVVAGRVKLLPLRRGSNPLSVMVEGTVIGERVRLCEESDPACTHRLGSRVVTATPAGPNPLMEFTIHVE
jgi:hypothetical protein